MYRDYSPQFDCECTWMDYYVRGAEQFVFLYDFVGERERDGMKGYLLCSLLCKGNRKKDTGKDSPHILPDFTYNNDKEIIGEYFMAKIVVDAGHGGQDPGAVFEGRQEKDDNLRLALAVGEALENNGQDVVFTRTEDVYQTPLQKARIANEEGADYFISIHRNSSPMPNQYNGVETLVYDDSGIKSEIAQNINSELEQVGFRNIGVKERPGLVVLRRTNMPAVLVEAGFINSEVDNRLFDENFDAMAQGIANGLMQAIQENGTAQEMEPETGSREGADAGQEVEEVFVYRVQTGAFAQPANAEALLYHLQQQGFPAYIIWEDGYYKVMVGEFEKLDNAVKLEAVLRRLGYNTFVTN